MGPCLSDFFETEYHPQLAPRCSVTPKRNLRFKVAFRLLPTTSFSGPMFTEFQQSMLSWCWAMTQKYFAPASSYMDISRSGSQFSPFQSGTISLYPCLAGCP